MCGYQVERSAKEHLLFIQYLILVRLNHLYIILDILSLSLLDILTSTHFQQNYLFVSLSSSWHRHRKLNGTVQNVKALWKIVIHIALIANQC